MKRKLLFLLATGVFLMNTGLLSSQGLMINSTLKKRIANSDFIIEASVISKYCTWDTNQKNIYTINTVLVKNRIKGILQSDTINIITPGGIVDNMKQEVFPSLNLKLNDTGLFFLNAGSIQPEIKINPFAYFKPNYSKLSFVKYNNENLSAKDAFNYYPDIERDIYGQLKSAGLNFDNILKTFLKPKSMVRSPNAVSITSFSPSTITAGTQSTLTITGTGFGATQGNGIVEFRDADDGGSGYVSPIASEYVSWSDTQIKVKVPNKAGTGDIRVTDDSGNSDVSSTDLSVTYDLINTTYNGNSYRLNMVDADGSGGIEFVFQTDFYNDANAMGAFKRALNSWRCSNFGGTGVYFVDGGSSTVDEIADDDVNIVRFDNGNELANGVLGTTHNRFTGCTSGGVIKWFVSEIDMVFNDVPYTGYTWNFDEADGTTSSSQYDFESVSVHELGHAHQLDHVIDNTQIMHYSISNGQEKRNLSQDDLDAGNDVLNFSSGVCGKSDMQVYTCTSQALKLLAFDATLQNNNIVLNWDFDDIFDLGKVELQKSKNGIDFYTIYSSDDKKIDFSYIDSDLYRENYYRLAYYDINDMVDYSKIVFVYNKNFQNANEITVYPNPFVNFIKIEGFDKTNDYCTLTDSEGKVLKQIHSNGKIDLSTFPAGFYFLKIKTPEKSTIKKLVKIKRR